MRAGKAMDGWSVRDAWVACMGDADFPPEVRPPEGGVFADTDHVVASFFGEVTDESLQRAHTAVRAIYPRLVTHKLPSSGFTGQSLRRHIAATTIEAMQEYRKEVDVLLREIRGDIAALRSWKLREVGDWFYIWDSLGSTGKNLVDGDVYDFYEFAGNSNRYGI